MIEKAASRFFFYFCAMDETEKVVLLLGSNIKPREKYLEDAVSLLEGYLGKSTAVSKVYESEPWGFESKTSFYNMAVVFDTRKTPEEVLHLCLQTEKTLGRVRSSVEGYTSRTMDVDILYFGNRVINSKRLTVPHPRLHLRRFTLLPLVETVPELIHPLLNKNQKKLLHECPDKSGVKLVN